MNSQSFFKNDTQGRTTLFHAAEIGDLESIKAIIFKLTGTGVCCQRLALINHQDDNGSTVIDVAKQSGHTEIADFLLSEKCRMEYFE